MPHNVLFNYINTYVAKQERTPYEKTMLVRARTRDLPPSNYLRFDLAEPLGCVLSGYELESDHISVYFDKIDQSDHHYTGYFSLKKHTYQLHVYFNDNDELIGEPTFTQLQVGAGAAASPPPLEVNPVLKEQFIQLARLRCGSTIPGLRNKLAKKIILLQDTYNRLEAEASRLSAIKPLNNDLYFAALDAIRAPLQELTRLVKHPHYLQMEQSIKKMQDAFKSLTQDSVIHLARPKHLLSMASIEELPANVPMSDQEALQPTQAALTIHLNKDIQALDEQFTAFKPSKVAENATGLRQFFIRANELSLLINESSYSVAIEQLQQLHTLNHRIHKAGETLLRTVLKKSKADPAAIAYANLLQPFDYILTYQDVVAALESKNPHRLDFLLKTGYFLVNGQPLTIEKETYASAVHYCFQQPADMASCLSVLIENGASILVDFQGLPIAYRILSTDEHPLQIALSLSEMTDRKTLSSIDFYKKLISTLRCCLITNPQESASITASIDSYQATIAQLSDASMLPRQSPLVIKEKTASLMRIIQAPCIKEHSLRLKQDPEFIRLHQQKARLSKEFMLKLPAIQKSAVLKHSAEIFKDVASILENIDDSIPYVKMKALAIDHVNGEIQYFENKIRLMDLQKTLISTQRGSISRHTKQLMAEQVRLITLTTSYEKEHGLEASRQRKADFDQELASRQQMKTSITGAMTNLQQMLDTLRQDLNFVKQANAATVTELSDDDDIELKLATFKSFFVKQADAKYHPTANAATVTALPDDDDSDDDKLELNLATFTSFEDFANQASAAKLSP